MNQLKNALSPYLLQHASNPVHWRMWDDSVVTFAKNQNKLLLISIGYSACHWCHVMEHESFEDHEVAKLMNQYFINIKIDREERPDVDAVYMKAVQMMTGSGGWPLNVICLPDGRPVWGGTYFKKHQWMEALTQLASLFENDFHKMESYASQLQAGVRQMSIVAANPNVEDFSLDNLDLMIKKWKKSFDREYGGYARAPKFMMPTNLDFLMRYAHQFEDDEIKNHVVLTLNSMAYGGIFDTVHGGFSRYSVDIKWHIPHFEKMLYDNAQLISTYSQAYKWVKNDLFLQVVEKTIQFIKEVWSFEASGFYSALDADSLDDNQKLKEGAFYVWKKEELKTILKEDFEVFSIVFNVNEFGYWEEESYVLIQSESLENLSIQLGISVSELRNKKSHWESLLKEKRSERSLPRLDDKCVISWNALMITGLLEAYKAFQDEEYLEMAVQCANFIQKKCWNPDGNLVHNYKNEKAYNNGFLEDYATVIQAWIQLFEVTTQEVWLEEAYSLCLHMIDDFYDEEVKMFRFKSNKEAVLIAKHFEIEDNVIPSSNSIVCKAIQKLGLYFENPKLREISQAQLKQILPQIDYPSAFSNWLDAFLNTQKSHKEVVVCSSNVESILKVLNQKYLPNSFIIGQSIKSNIPILKYRFFENEERFYVCKNNICEAPLNNIQDFLKLLKLQVLN